MCTRDRWIFDLMNKESRLLGKNGSLMEPKANPQWPFRPSSFEAPRRLVVPKLRLRVHLGYISSYCTGMHKDSKESCNGSIRALYAFQVLGGQVVLRFSLVVHMYTDNYTHIYTYIYIYILYIYIYVCRQLQLSKGNITFGPQVSYRFAICVGEEQYFVPV